MNPYNWLKIFLKNLKMKRRGTFLTCWIYLLLLAFTALQRINCTRCVNLLTVLQVMMYSRSLKRNTSKLFSGQEQTGSFYSICSTPYCLKFSLRA
uniref:Uncharacterized protein n=1 Tax=Arundo donax TaxID=35708 RepID=A0A0A9JIQ6_ARUDO